MAKNRTWRHRNQADPSIAANDNDQLWSILDADSMFPIANHKPPAAVVDGVEANAMDSIQMIAFEIEDEMALAQMRDRAVQYCYMAFNVSGLTSVIAANADKVVHYWQHNGETEIPGNQLALNMPEYAQVFAKQDLSMRRLVRIANASKVLCMA